MKKALLLVAALALTWSYQANVNVVDAHGGAYRGPAGEVPPGGRDPKDPSPPPEPPSTPGDPSGPTTPPDNGPTTPPDDGGGAPDGPPPPTPPMAPPGLGGGPVSGKRAAPKQMSFDNWLFWWNYNKDDILNLKARVKRNEKKIGTDSAPYFLGGASAGSAPTSPTEQEIANKVVPALLQVVSNPDIHPDIRGGSLIALARTAKPGGGQEYLKIFFEIAKASSKEDKVVKESAIIALGILQLTENEEVRDFLLQIVDDKDYDARGRSFAMFSLGLLKANTPEVFAALERRLDGREANPDLPVSALLTIGLIGDTSRVPILVDWLKSGRIGQERLNDQTRAWVISALGKIGDPSALPEISKALKDRGRYAKNAASIALGQLVPQIEAKEQLSAVRALVQFHKNESDLSAKNFTLIALGRIAGAKSAPDDVREQAVAYLLNAFMEANKATERPFAALALGLAGFDPENDKPSEMKYKIAETIRRELKEMKGDKVALGALAISLGMIGDRDSVDLLVSILQDRGIEKKLRGSAAMALGLIGDSRAKEAILSALAERQDRDLRVDTAVAAGLIGDQSAVDILVSVLDDIRASQFELGSVALALGQIGDKRAIPPLLRVLEADKTNGKFPDLTRALVSVALGQLSNRRDIRVLARISKDINYRSSTPTLDEMLSIL